MAKHNETGKWGEDMAADMLIKQGFAILERNWHMGKLEVDIIARKDGLLVIAEVKTRAEKDADPFEAITKRKMLNMVHAADAFIQAKEVDYDVRFDLFAVSGTPDDFTIEHLPDAFYAPLRSYR